MKTLYLFQDEYPWDVRVEKVVRSLTKAHKVTILCRNRGGLEERETIEGVNIVRVGGAGMRSITGFPAFFSPWWIAAGLSIIRKAGVQLIIVRDLPLAPLALLLKRLTGVPVIFDMAEDYPAMIQTTWKTRGPRLSDYFVRNPFLLRILERLVLSRVDETWVVSQASLERIRTRTENPVVVVRNTPTPDILKIVPEEPKACDQLRLVYTGWVDDDRGLETVVRAVALARETGVPMTFDIVGTGCLVAKLDELARTLGVGNAVIFHGWQSQPKMRNIISQGDVGIVPHLVTVHTSTTLPNKIYDYMALGKPVVVSEAPALQQLVESASCGLVFRDQDAHSLLECLLKLRSSELRRELGGNGRRAVSESMNWSVDEAVIMAAVSDFEKRC